MVFLIKEKSTGNEYALKEISPPQKIKGKSGSIKYQQDFFKEAENLSKCDYPSIIHLHKISIDSPYWLVTEYCPNGSVQSFIGDDEVEDVITKKMIIIYGVAFGLKYLHSLNMVHRDIKPANILLDSNYYPKICDLGLAKLNSSGSEKNSTLAGTPNYCAPEVLLAKDGSKYDGKKADVFSFGSCLYSIFLDKFPFEELSNTFQVCSTIVSGGRPTIPEASIPKVFQDLIKKCWSQESSDRPDFSSIVSTLMDPNTIKEIKEFYPDFHEEKLKEYLDLLPPISAPVKTVSSVKMTGSSEGDILEQFRATIMEEMKKQNQDLLDFLSDTLKKFQERQQKRFDELKNTVMSVDAVDGLTPYTTLCIMCMHAVMIYTTYMVPCKHVNAFLCVWMCFEKHCN